MRNMLTLPRIDYSDTNAFVFPALSNKLIGFDLNAGFNRFGSCKPLPFHCFVDDWRLESIWRDSHFMLNRFIDEKSPLAIAPDFTVDKDYPLPFAFHQVWRSRVIAAYWQKAGVYTVPCIKYSRPAINAVLFDGLASCEVVAIRSPSRGDEKIFCNAARQFLEMNNPSLVLHFGTSRGFRVWGSVGYQMNLNTL